mgnify:CR=1 FL=1
MLTFTELMNGRADRPASIDLLKTAHSARRKLDPFSRLAGDVEYILLSYAVLIGVLAAGRENALLKLAGS